MNTTHDSHGPVAGGRPGGDTPPPVQGPRRSRDELRDLGRMRRTVGGQRQIAGVAGGLARHFDIDPVIIRVALVVLIFFGGAGLLIYGACWLLVPEEGQNEAAVSLDARNRQIALVGVGVLAGLALIGDSWGVFGFPWPIAFVGLVVALVLMSRQRKERGAGPVWPQQPPAMGEQYQAYAPAQAPIDLHKDAAPAAEGTDPVGQPSAPGAEQQQAPGFAGGAPTPPVWTPQPQRPRRPRKPGPLLFGWTLALIALTLGVLGTLDVAGVNIPDSAYPASAVAVSGVMLLVGAFYGRAGGIILIGFIAALATLGQTAAETWEPESVTHTPATAADVQPSYRMETGELVIDLSEISDPAELDGRTLDIKTDVGRVEVILPPDLDVDWDASVGIGSLVQPTGTEQGGFDVSKSGSLDVADDQGTLQLDVALDIGEIRLEPAA